MPHILTMHASVVGDSEYAGPLVANVAILKDVSCRYLVLVHLLSSLALSGEPASIPNQPIISMLHPALVGSGVQEI